MLGTTVKQVIVIAPYGARQVVIAYSCVCVGHEGRPRAAGPRATRVTYTYAVAGKELIERPGR